MMKAWRCGGPAVWGHGVGRACWADPPEGAPLSISLVPKMAQQMHQREGLPAFPLSSHKAVQERQPPPSLPFPSPFNSL